MAADGEETGSSWPLPPMQYIENYTDEAVATETEPKPPPPMSLEPYTMFGQPFHPNEGIIRSLESQKFKRLYPQNYDHKRELKRMNHSLLANFLDLLDILVKAPDSVKRLEKIDDIRLLFINTHHLINEYRKHQARETIRVLLQVQKKQRLDLADRFQKQLDKVTDNLQQHLSTIPDSRTSSIQVSALPSGMTNVKSEPMEATEEDVSVLSATTRNLDRLMCQIIDAEMF